MAQQQTVEAELRLIDGMQFVGHGSQSGSAIVLDASPEHGGEGRGYRPTELIPLALAGCTGMDVISILRKKRQDVTGFEVRVSATRADKHPRRYTAIALEFVVRGHGISENAVARSIQLSQEKYCSVTASLNAAISTTFQILEDGSAR